MIRRDGCENTLGPRAFADLYQDVEAFFAAVERGDDTVSVHYDWDNWEVLRRLVNEVAQYRNGSGHEHSIRAQRIREGRYTGADYWDT